jgi:hypothetical protein
VNDDTTPDAPRVVTVVLTDRLAARSLAAAHERGMSRSAWVRHLVESALTGRGQKEHN